VRAWQAQDIIQALAGAATGQTDFQRELSLSYERIDDVLVARGNLPEALKSYYARPFAREASRIFRTSN
jgi:hypothetical protein